MRRRHHALTILVADLACALRPHFDKGNKSRGESSHRSITLSTDKIHFATVDTRTDDPHRLLGPPEWNWVVHNLGAGKELVYGSVAGGGAPQRGDPQATVGNSFDYSAKLTLMQDWVNTLPDDQLVVFLDGGDTMYGGCDLDDLASRFELLQKNTNSRVIAGAEYTCTEAPFGTSESCDNYPVRGREEVLDAFHLKVQDLDSWKDSHGESLKFLNSGFYMGRAKDLRQLYVEWARTRSRWMAVLPEVTDQGWLAQVLQERPDLLALDYASVLVNNLFGVSFEKDGQQLFAFDGVQKQWISSSTHKPVCFFHANGAADNENLANGFKDLQRIAGERMRNN